MFCYYVSSIFFTFVYYRYVCNCTLYVHSESIPCLRVAPRMFCDICDVFDAHETEDCPQQAMSSDSPPPSHYAGSRDVVRPYCDSCESQYHLLPLTSLLIRMENIDADYSYKYNTDANEKPTSNYPITPSQKNWNRRRNYLIIYLHLS